MELLGIGESVGFVDINDFVTRRANREPLLELLSGRMAGFSTRELFDRLRGEVPCAPVRSMNEALSSEELEALRMEITYHHPELGEVKSVANPLRFDDARPGAGPGPMLDHDRAAILANAGISEEEAHDFDRLGAFGVSR